MTWLRNIKRSDWLILAIYYSIILVIQFFGEWLEEDFAFFSHETRFLLFNVCLLELFLEFLALLVIVFYIVPKYFYVKRYLTTFVLIISVLALLRVIQSYLLSIIYEPLFPDLTLNLLWGILNNGESISFIAFMLLAKSHYSSKTEIVALQKAQKENELRLLQAQIDPHFLFNNLNILDTLINTDPAKASIYTNRLSSLYRYMIRTKDEDIVSLDVEWSFCQDYLYLLEQRFTGLITVDAKLSEFDLSQYWLPPAAIQTLLENVVKHNVALPGQPFQIWVTIREDHLVVKNKRLPKADVKDSTGTGLDNLEARLLMLTDKRLKVESDSDFFEVAIPLVKELGTTDFSDQNAE